MKVKIFGADNQSYDFEVGELENIKTADMEVWDGLEVLLIETAKELTILQAEPIYTFKNGFWRVWDEHHYDGGYQVYNHETGVNLFANKKWLNAESMADRMI